MTGLKEFLRIAAGCVIAAWCGGCTGQTLMAAAKKSPCAEAETQLSLTTCWSKLAKAAERRVDSRFQQVRVKLDPKAFPERTAAFVAAQARWRSYRDAHCKAVESVYEDGSMAPMQAAICRMRVTEARDAELKALLSDLDGLAAEK